MYCCSRSHINNIYIYIQLIRKKRERLARIGGSLPTTALLLYPLIVCEPSSPVSYWKFLLNLLPCSWAGFRYYSYHEHRHVLFCLLSPLLGWFPVVVRPCDSDVADGYCSFSDTVDTFLTGFVAFFDPIPTLFPVPSPLPPAPLPLQIFCYPPSSSSVNHS